MFHNAAQAFALNHMGTTVAVLEAHQCRQDRPRDWTRHQSVAALLALPALASCMLVGCCVVSLRLLLHLLQPHQQYLKTESRQEVREGVLHPTGWPAPPAVYPRHLLWTENMSNQQ